MSADLLRKTVGAKLQKEADECANVMLNVNVSGSCEQIALHIAQLRGMALAITRAMDILDTEYQDMVNPEPEAEERPKAREIY